MKRIFGIVTIVLILFMGCRHKQAFTTQERETIISGTGIMRLWTADNAEDSVLLRAKAMSLGKTEMESEIYSALKQRMLETVNDTNNQGVGIAAPQVGISRQLIAVQRFDKEGESFEFYANPRITYYSDEKECGPEGCLSVPGVRDSVFRSTRIVVCYMDASEYTERKDTVEGFTAVIFQHEIDHLNGVLFTDKSVKKISL